MKNKICQLIATLYFFVSFNASSQVYTLYGDKSFGTFTNDFYPSIVQTDSTHFILVGYTSANMSGDKTDDNCFNGTLLSDIWLLKVDTGFNILWDKTYGGDRPETQMIPTIRKNSKQILISCTSNSDSTCTKLSHSRNYPAFSSDYWMLSLDSNGNYNNQFTYGGAGIDKNPQTIELTSGNLITCGSSNSAVNGDKSVPPYDSTGGQYDYWVIKSDSNGNKLWDKVLGGIGNEQADFGWYAFGYSILADKDDAFILAGSSDSPMSPDISDTCRGTLDIWLIKIDSTGNKVWDRRYGGIGGDLCNRIIRTIDNGYIICGDTNSPQGLDVSDTSRGHNDCWILKLDSLGNKQWDKRYGGDLNDFATWIELAPEGGYWVSGYSESNISGEVSEPKYATGSKLDFWIFNIDDSGNKIWDKRFGGPGGSIGSQFIIMPDSSIFLAGMSMAGTSAVKTDAGKGLNDYWVVHFKYTCTSSAIISAVACNSYTSPSGNYNWTATGVYTDTLTNATGCDSVITINLTINTVTTAVQSITACNSYISPSGNYNWTASGIYTDTLTNATGCDSVITVNLTINVVDTSVTVTAPYLSSNATGAAYQWMYCDSSFIAGAINQSYTATANGWYAVIVVQNGCEDTSSCYLILNVGMDENEYKNLLNIYPNPVTDVTTITAAAIIKSIELTNVVGQTLYQQTVNNKWAEVHLENYPEGFYFIKITSENYSVIKKVIRL